MTLTLQPSSLSCRRPPADQTCVYALDSKSHQWTGIFTVQIRARPGPARPGPAHPAPASARPAPALTHGPPHVHSTPRPGKARAHGRPGKARAPAARITHAPGKQGLVPPLAQASTRCPLPVRPGTLTYTTHSHASTARTGFAGAIRLHLRLLPTHLRCTALKAPNRPGLARVRTADSDNARAELG